MKRRDFLATTTGCTCFLLTTSGWAATRITEPTGPVKIGELKSFTQQGMDTRWLPSHGFILVRNQNLLYALSAVCTHDQRTHVMGRSGGEKLVCPNHGSQYALDGTLIRGPARHNLGRFAITVDGTGQVTVDTSKLIDPDKTSETPAFVRIN